MELTDAYRECERITWSQARNFAYGIRLLPPAKRRGLAAIYAFARRIDDIGDGTMPAEHKIADLEQARRAVLDLGAAKPPGAPAPDDPVLIALADVQRAFPVPMEAFGELIDGCVADVRGTSYQTFDDLLWYCRCVAGSIGRLSLGIFGTRRDTVQITGQITGQVNGHAAELADSLGVALQLTNILRDIREDYGNGRVYLPAEDLAKFDVDLGGTTPPDPPALLTGGAHLPRPSLGETHLPRPSSGGAARPPIPPGPGFTRLVEFEAERARDWYATGLRLLTMLDRRSAACTGAMAGIYRQLLERIAAQPAAVLQGRMSLSGREKALVAIKALAGRMP